MNFKAYEKAVRKLAEGTSIFLREIPKEEHKLRIEIYDHTRLELTNFLCTNVPVTPRTGESGKNTYELGTELSDQLWDEHFQNQ
jgi:hypothetical protein